MKICNKYYTVTQVAKALNVTRQTVSRWNRLGLIHGERIGRQIIFKRADIDALRCSECGKLKVVSGGK